MSGQQIESLLGPPLRVPGVSAPWTAYFPRWQVVNEDANWILVRYEGEVAVAIKQRPMAIAATPKPVGPAPSIAPGSLTIHGVRPGMSRQQIEKILIPVNHNLTSIYLYRPCSPNLITVYYHGNLAYRIRGRNQVEQSGRPFLDDALSQEELRKQLGPPACVETNGDWRYDRLQLLIGFCDIPEYSESPFINEFMLESTIASRAHSSGQTIEYWKRSRPHNTPR